MTSIAVACPAAAPTAYERVLLGLSAHLSALATTRMQRRVATAHRAALRRAVDDVQRDAAVVHRAGMLPR